ncbi:MAG: BolA family transcriptional regulator [Alphaproteobacteria bacterium]|jgi:stress-induced morphogen|nr:BolA family transcriptional regulator [Alphaproteobacteria bacterium]MBP9868407.1 BolA family transcriptional regulator [Alphaproteobacteria bacterium]
MPMDSAIIKQMILSALPECSVKIIDLAGDGDHYAVHVTSSAFAGKSRIQQHQMVYAALGDKLRGELHALSVQTSVPTV